MTGFCCKRPRIGQQPKSRNENGRHGTTVERSHDDADRDKADVPRPLRRL
jgi:hypothetical protein